MIAKFEQNRKIGCFEVQVCKYGVRISLTSKKTLTHLNNRSAAHNNAI